jgi:hypothetical protein
VPGVLVALVGSSAFAYWSAEGAGAGSGSTASSVAVTLSPGVAAADLRPGGVGDVVLQVSNPSSYVAEIGSLALDVSRGDGGYAVDPAHIGCALTVLGYTTQTNGGAGWTVPAASGGDDGTLPIILADALDMSEEAANTCQGATLTVYLKAGV